MQVIVLRTEKCIVTGGPVRVVTGHVKAKILGNNFALDEIHILAGFASDDIQRSVESDAFGCFGEWKPEYGAVFDDSYKEPIE